MPVGQSLPAVKGTTSDGTQILLTRNEVAHAKRHYPRVALFILANVQIETSDSAVYEASGGQVSIHEPWCIEESALVPLAYAYTPPSHR